MTEAEWLACDEFSVVLQCLAGRTSARKLRLALCGVLRAADVWPLLTSRASRRAVDVGEDFADGRVRLLELGEARLKANAAAGREWRKSRVQPPAASLANLVCRQDHGLMTGLSLADGYLTQLPPRAHVLHDVIGNPFRPVVISSAWRTDTVVSLARQMYESREFSAMPILADALQDAGCDSDDILNHCRGPGPHVRGCWVCDLVLGKE